jgi:hypothetical protein
VWRGYVSVPKGGRSRYVPLTARLTAALRDLRHLKGPRVACQPDGSALTQWMVRDFVKQATHRARLLEGLENPSPAGRHSIHRGDISETKGGESAKSL